MNRKSQKYRNVYLSIIIGIVLTIAIITGVLSSRSSARGYHLSPYPFGKNFAFTICDDPDWTRLEKIRPVYDFLTEAGLRTTIAVWPLNATRANGVPDIEGDFDYGDTLQRDEYRKYVVELKRRGFEIALHTASGGNDLRVATQKGYEEFKAIFGEYPKMNIMHSNNLENVYWGTNVLRNRLASTLLRELFGHIYPKVNYPFAGENPKSPYFWGDILRERTKYVRMWGTSDINTLRFNPTMPYHDPEKPYVNYWFSFSDGYNLEFFNKLISDRKIGQLVDEEGASIVYTHFSGFAKTTNDGSYVLDEHFKKQIMKIAHQKGGWFVPVSVLLDRLLAMKNVVVLDAGPAVVVINSNSYPVEGVTVRIPQDEPLFDASGMSCPSQGDSKIVIPKINGNGSVTFYKKKASLFLRNVAPGTWESIRLVWKRFEIWLLYHKG